MPQRETGMTSYEIMLSESQERMLLVADKGREGEVLAVFASGVWMRHRGHRNGGRRDAVRHNGELVAEFRTRR